MKNNNKELNVIDVLKKYANDLPIETQTRFIAVFAGDYKQFKTYESIHKLNKHYQNDNDVLIYVTNRSCYLGYEIDSIITYGTYYDVKDFDVLYNECKSRMKRN